MGRQTNDGLWRITTTRHRLSVCDMSVIERRPAHLYECLWGHYCRMRNIVTCTLLLLVYWCCVRVVPTHHKPSPLLATRYGPGVLDMCEITVILVLSQVHWGYTEPALRSSISHRNFCRALRLCGSILNVYVCFSGMCIHWGAYSYCSEYYVALGIWKLIDCRFHHLQSMLCILRTVYRFKNLSLLSM